jgi:hypothetical protein
MKRDEFSVTHFRCHDLKKLIRIANITAPLTDNGIFDLPKAA